MASVSSAPNDSFVITNVKIFTGKSFIEQGYVVCKHGKIVAVETGDYQPDPSSKEQVISRVGHTLLPGFIDSHVHGLGGNILCLEQSLRFGVTTVCDMHNDVQFIQKLQDLADNPETKNLYADFKCAGTSATIKGGWPEAVVLGHDQSDRTKAMIAAWPKLKSPSEAEQFVQDQIDHCGASYIKLMHEVGDTLKANPVKPSTDLQTAIIKAAHRQGLKAYGHAFSYQGAKELLECGVDGLTHSILDAPPSNAEEYLALFRRNDAHINPTLTVCASQTGEGTETQARFNADPLVQSLLCDSRQPREPLGLAGPGAGVTNSIQFIKTLYNAGIPILPGSDASGQIKGAQFGLGVHMEMHALVHDVQMPPVDVLKAVTSLTAQRMGLVDRGNIEVGKKADLLLIDGDAQEVLLDKNQLLLPIRGVWRDGVLTEFWKSTSH